MAIVPGLRRLFRLATGRSTSVDDVEEELRLHLDLRAEELIAEGMAPAAARVEALRRFGDLSDIRRSVGRIDRERERAMRRAEWLDSILGDLRHAIRGLRRNPGFAVATALTLGLGIGLNVAIFSVYDGVILRPLPFAEPDRLARLWSTKTDRGLRFFSISAPDFLDWRTQSRSFERLAAFERQRDVTLTGGSEPEQLQAARISAELFPLLGVAPVLGRVFGAEADRAGAPGGRVVLSYGVWQRRFGGSPDVLGSAVILDGEPWTVIGVMPRDFALPGNPAQLWMPLSELAATADRGNRFLRVLGRLRPGVELASAREELNTIARRIEAQFPGSNTGWTITVLGLTDAVVGEQFRAAVTILLGAVGLVLLIACANVATMVLGRSNARSRELAVRAALGAGVGRLGRLLLAEGFVLGAVGGGFGVALAFGMVRLLRALAPANLPRLDQIGVNGTALGVAAVLSLASGLAFGLIPLRRAGRSTLTHSLRDGGRGVAGGRDRQRSQRLLVVAEMTLAVLLLSGAGLLIRSLFRLQRVDLGFEPEQVLVVDLTLPAAGYPTPGRVAGFYESLLRRAASLPGVRDVAAVSSVPLGGPNAGTVFAVEGRTLPDPKATPDADYRTVTPGYFRLMGIPLRGGRDFTEQDDSTSSAVVIISATAARRFWPGADPVGARIRLGDVLRGPVAEVVGVVGDVRHLSLEAPEYRPMLYLPLRRTGQRSMSVLIGAAREPTALVQGMRRELYALDPNQPVSAVRTLDGVVAGAFSQRRFNVVVLGLFAFAALVLAAIGLYGVMAYAVTQRTHEIGVRLALGAGRRTVVAMVMGELLRLVLVGVLLGLGGALLLGRTLASLLFEVKPRDPASLIIAAAVLLGVALVGSYLPARRAARVDPLTALRAE
jgi:putative ABC transport system permease protein